jgi:molybdenum cofactor guanylyltransferase
VLQTTIPTRAGVPILRWQRSLKSAFPSSDVTLGILAGGRATRLGGVDKAWLRRGGIPQVLRLSRRFKGQVATVFISANRDLDRYGVHGLAAVADRSADAGPLGGLEALANACMTPWLLTLPVDVIGVNECLLASLAAAAGERGAFAVDEDGPQPLVALWPSIRLRECATSAIVRDALSVQALQQTLAMTEVRFAGVRFGNLNTPADLAAAGVSP